MFQEVRKCVVLFLCFFTVLTLQQKMQLLLLPTDILKFLDNLNSKNKGENSTLNCLGTLLNLTFLYFLNSELFLQIMFSYISNLLDFYSLLCHMILTALYFQSSSQLFIVQQIVSRNHKALIQISNFWILHYQLRVVIELFKL